MALDIKPGPSLDAFISKAGEAAKSNEAIVLSGKTKVKLAEQKGSLEGRECVVKKGDAKMNRASMEKFFAALSKTYGETAAARAWAILGDDREAGRPLTGAKVNQVMTAVKNDNRGEIDAYIAQVRANDKEYGGQKARLAETFLRAARETGAKLTPGIKKEVEALVNSEIQNIRNANARILDQRLGKISGPGNQLSSLCDAPENKWIPEAAGGGNARLNVEVRRAVMGKQIEEKIDALTKELSDAKPNLVEEPKTGGLSGGKQVDKSVVDKEQRELQNISARNERLIDETLKNAKTGQEKLNLLLDMSSETAVAKLASDPLAAALLKEAIEARIKDITKEVGGKPSDIPKKVDVKPEVKMTEGTKGVSGKPEVKSTEGTKGTDAPKTGPAPTPVSIGMYGRTIGNPEIAQRDLLGADIWKKEGARDVLNITNAQCKQITASNTCFILSVVNGLLKSPAGREYLASLVKQNTDGSITVRFPGDPQGFEGGNLVPKNILVRPADVARHRLASGHPDDRPAILVALECAACSYAYQTSIGGEYRYGKYGQADEVARGLGLEADTNIQPSIAGSLLTMINNVGAGSSLICVRSGLHFVSVAGQGKAGNPTPPSERTVDPQLDKHLEENVLTTQNDDELARKLQEVEDIRNDMLAGKTVDFKVFDSLEHDPQSDFHVKIRDLFDGHVRNNAGVPIYDGLHPRMKPGYAHFFKYNLPK